MYTVEQIRSAGQAGEISSIDVEHLINILKRENEVSDISAEEVLEKHWPCSTYIGHTVVKGKIIEEEYHEDKCSKCANEENVIAAMHEYASIVNERKDSAGSSYDTNDIDLAYLTGAFNVGGMGGLSQEIKRIKKLGKQPYDIIDFCKKNAAELHNDESQPKESK